MTSASSPTWLVCQLGAREHYAIAVSLHRANRLEFLLTDAWVPPESALGAIGPARFRDRYHAALAQAPVRAWNGSAFAFESMARLVRRAGWPLIMSRNAWFRQKVAAELRAMLAGMSQRQHVLFSYSYSALGAFEVARQQGWMTVLGQIDPGPAEERIVAKLHRAHPELSIGWRPAPPEYWDAWRRECSLADHIIVNSDWAKDALLEEGIPEQKLHTIPLAYEAPADAAAFGRKYPAAFTRDRPLRVLFLGQANLRKGIELVVETARLMRDDPVEFWIVGPRQIGLPIAEVANPAVRWFGAVPRSEAAEFYRKADVFLFPTHSDGFGLTQLEARAWRLPVIASQYCGKVVSDRQNGFVLQELSAARIVESLRQCIEHPEELGRYSESREPSGEFSFEALQRRLLAIA